MCCMPDCIINHKFNLIYLKINCSKSEITVGNTYSANFQYKQAISFYKSYGDLVHRMFYDTTLNLIICSRKNFYTEI